ncbi:MAG: hypothetical protein J7480_07800, partial [Microbacteriaceae bacterium]|nr:hypothetical protein [Microbacteriaceae bacterium]
AWSEHRAPKAVTPPAVPASAAASSAPIAVAAPGVLPPAQPQQPRPPGKRSLWLLVGAPVAALVVAGAAIGIPLAMNGANTPPGPVQTSDPPTPPVTTGATVPCWDDTRAQAGECPTATGEAGLRAAFALEESDGATCTEDAETVTWTCTLPEAPGTIYLLSEFESPAATQEAVRDYAEKTFPDATEGTFSVDGGGDIGIYFDGSGGDTGGIYTAYMYDALPLTVEVFTEGTDEAAMTAHTAAEELLHFWTLEQLASQWGL